MNILVIGDAHGEIEKVRKVPLKEADLILLTGDLGSANLKRKMAFENVERRKDGLDEKEFSAQEKRKAYMETYSSALKLIEYLTKFAPVYTIFGNAEDSNADARKLSKEIKIKLPRLYNELIKIKNVRVINNQVANFHGIRIGGLEYFIDENWVETFQPADYKKALAHAKSQTKKARKVLKWFDGLDILLCHQPPLGILDKVNFHGAPKHWQNKHAGSKTILEAIKKYSPQYVFCGHIHEAEGMKRVGKTEVYNLGVAGYKLIEMC